MIIRPVQCRMARVGLGLTVIGVAKLAKVSTNIITRLERGERLLHRTHETILLAFEEARLCSLMRIMAE